MTQCRHGPASKVPKHREGMSVPKGAITLTVQSNTKISKVRKYLSVVKLNVMFIFNIFCMFYVLVMESNLSTF